jgi:hypothetical protein
MRSWEEGKCLIFDDSFEHEVWNHSTGRRVVLLLRFWHPGIGDWEAVLNHAEESFRQFRLSQLPPVEGGGAGGGGWGTGGGGGGVEGGGGGAGAGGGGAGGGADC